jgi:putative transposase
VQNRAYKFRIYPNQEQSILFAKTFGCVRFIYNQRLAELALSERTYKCDCGFVFDRDQNAAINRGK